MKYFRALLCIFLIIIVTFSFTSGYKKISEDKIIKDKPSFKGIISLWQIDTFEGGRGSRKQFLLKIAREFEKNNVGVLVMVSDMTIEGAKKKMENNEYPDMISYGTGINIDKFTELNCKNVVKGGIVNNKVYATAWCKGGYFLFRHKAKAKKKGFENSITVLKSENTCPEIALLMSEKAFDRVVYQSPLESYLSFVSFDYEYMLGTQRDIERLSKREIDYELTPIYGFNDIFNFISACTENKEKKEFCEEYIDLLISRKSQEKLKDIAMFSPYYEISLDNLNMQANQYFGEYLTISAFYSIDKIVEAKNIAKENFTDKKTALTKIKKMLI